MLLSHRDDDGGSSHHLLAYLFDGKTFRPVARLNLESYYQNVTSVALGEIADGGIELLLHTRRAGDPACCPSGRRNATFELRDGQFVLVAEFEFRGLTAATLMAAPEARGTGRTGAGTSPTSARTRGTRPRES